MKTLLISALAATLFSAAFATPSFAMTGDEAIAKCHKVHNCTVYDGPGGVLIFGPKGGTVDCPTHTSQCTATPRKGAAPTRQNNVINTTIQG